MKKFIKYKILKSDFSCHKSENKYKHKLTVSDGSLQDVPVMLAI